MKTRNPHIRKTLRILGKILGMLMLAAIAAFWVPYIVRALFCDQFVVPSESMLPTLAPGDRILVNKLIVGARIYKKFDFSEGAALHSFRLPGFRKVRVNDIVVFNVPQGYDRDKIEFRINYVYAKRCIGTPGDSVSIRNGRFRNNHWSGPIGDTVQQQVLARMPDSLFSAGTTIAATLANNFAEADDQMQSVLFALGLLLLAMSFAVQAISLTYLKRTGKRRGEV